MVESWQGAQRQHGAATLDWRKRMSDNVAVALIVYTAINIFATMHAMKATGMKSLALVALVILVGAIIPACHRFDKRWRDLPDDAAADPALRGAFQRDRFLLWLLAIGLPVAITGALMLAAGAAA